MHLPAKLRRSLDRNDPNTPPRERQISDETRNTPEPHPIADQFMRQASLRKNETDNIVEHHVPRKPVPSEARPSEQLTQSSPHPATVRMVPEPSVRDRARKIDREEDDLALAAARLAVRDSTPDVETFDDASPSAGRKIGAQAAAASRGHLPRSSLDKSLPILPAEDDEDGREEYEEIHQRELPLGTISPARHARDDHREEYDEETQHRLCEDPPARARAASARDAGDRHLITDSVDLTNTEDTTTHTRHLPAVTHETILQPLHEIEHRQLTREVHQDHIYHRLLPIEDVAVLPARHFIQNPATEQLREVTGSEIPGGLAKSKRVEKAVKTAYTIMMPKDDRTPAGPRQFSARAFEGGEGDAWSGETGEGVWHTETTWVHPVRLEDGGSGEGEAVHFGREERGKRPNG